MTAVSGNRPQPQDHIRATDRRTGKVGLARITYYGDTHAECSCGWSVGHTREKVREDAIDRHLNKKHLGRGIRL